MKKIITLIIGLVISGGAMYFLLRGDIETLRGEFSGGRYAYLIPAAVLWTLALVTRGFRWRVVLGSRTSTLHAFNIMNVGYMLNSMPLRVGELARAWMTTRLNPSIAFLTSLSTIVVERVLDLLAVLVMLGFALILLPVPSEVSATGVFLGIITLTMAVFMVYFAHRRDIPHRILKIITRHIAILERLNLEKWLDHFLDGLEPLTSTRVQREAILWTVLSWFLSTVTAYIFMLVFFEKGDMPAMMLTIVLLALAVAIPSVPGNLGTFEAAGVAGLYFAGVIASAEAPENAPAVAFALLLHVFTLAGYVLLGMIGLWMEQTSLSQVREGMSHVQEESTLQTSTG